MILFSIPLKGIQLETDLFVSGVAGPDFILPWQAASNSVQRSPTVCCLSSGFLRSDFMITASSPLGMVNSRHTAFKGGGVSLTCMKSKPITESAEKGR